MKVFKILTSGLMAVALCVGFTSCSDDDENVGDTIDTEAVFTNGWPKSAPGIYSITRNAEGLVTEMETSGGDVTFEYHNIKTRAEGEAYVLMTLRHRGETTYEAKLSLGSNGFVKSAEGTEYEEGYTEHDNWGFGYNSDGQLNYMSFRSTNSPDEETRITYSNGDITQVTKTDTEGDGFKCGFGYTSDEVTTPINNIGSVMLYDEMLNVDLDQMEVVYYAGLLGRATRHLPVSLYYDNMTYYFEWEINDSGLPEWVTIDGYREYFEW